MNVPWPLWGLVVRTPRLELRPDDDVGLLELAEEALLGVHPKDEMPFFEPWTDAPEDQLATNLLQFHWKQRSEFTPESWSVNFLVRSEGRVVGTQQLSARGFATVREVTSGSWVGQRHQGNGYGSEMRAAVLMLAFDHLGATQARSASFEDNPASLAVSHKLGYVADGTERRQRRGERAQLRRLVLTRERFEEKRPEWDVDVTGLSECRPMLVGEFPGGTGDAEAASSGE